MNAPSPFRAFPLLFALAAFSLPMAADEVPITLGLPFPVGDPVTVPVPQSQPAVASNGEQALVVWLDFRAGLGPEVWGARVDGEGELLDPHGFRISGERRIEAQAADPVVAWADGVYLVVWERQWFDVVGVRVSEQGEVLDPEPFPIFSGIFSGEPLIASNGELFLVVGSYLPMQMKLIDVSGKMVARPSHDFFASAESYFPAVASDGDGFLAVARRHQTSEKFVVRVSASGEVDVTPVDLPDDLLWTDLTWNGSAYVLLAASRWFSPSKDLTVVRIDRDGRVVSHGTLIHGGPGRPIRPSITALPDGSLIAAWVEVVEAGPLSGELWLAEIDTDGEVRRRSVGLQKTWPQLTVVRGRPLFVWNSSTRAGSSIRISPVDTSLSLSEDPSSASLAAANQAAPAATRSETAIAYVWEERVGARPPRVAFGIGGLVPFGPTGGAELHPSESEQRNPVVASDGRDFLVVWKERAVDNSSSVVAMRLAADGTKLDAAPIRLAEIAHRLAPAAIGWNGHVYLVAWSSAEGVAIVRLTREGIVLDDEAVSIVPSPREAAQSHLSLTAMRDGMTLLVWQDGAPAGLCQFTCPPPPPSPRVLAVVLDANGIPVGPSAVEIAPGLSPSAAAKGEETMIVWRSDEGFGSAVVASDGQVRHGGEIVAPYEHLFDPPPPVVVPISEGWLVAWEQQEDRSYQRGIRAALLDGDLAVRESLLSLVDGSLPESPRLVRVSGSTALLLYVELTEDDSVWGGTRRLFVRSVHHDPAQTGASPRRRTVSGRR